MPGSHHSEGIGFLVVFCILGAVLILGSLRRWSWLVDPPEALWPFYSQSAIKKFFGRNTVQRFTLLVGIALIVFAIVELIREIQ